MPGSQPPRGSPRGPACGVTCPPVHTRRADLQAGRAHLAGDHCEVVIKLAECEHCIQGLTGRGLQTRDNCSWKPTEGLVLSPQAQPSCTCGPRPHQCSREAGRQHVFQVHDSKSSGDSGSPLCHAGANPSLCCRMGHCWPSLQHATPAAASQSVKHAPWPSSGM